MNSLKRISIILLSILAIVSCSPKITQETQTRVEYRETTVYRDSIVYYPVRDCVVVNKTKDTTSVVETDMAWSKASVKDGSLYHELRNKSGLRPVRVSLPTTIATETRTETITRTVEVPAQLSKWQNFRIHLGDALIAIIVAFLIFVIARAIWKR